MAGSSIYHLNPISADTNAGTGAMAGASQSFSHAGTVFGELRKSILDEEQRKIEQDFKERQFAEAIRQFGLTDDRANRIAAETERHNKATEEYQLKNLAETSRYHTASLAAQKAYHDAIIGVRNRNIDAKYGDRGSIRNAYHNYLFGEDTPSDNNGSKSTAKPPVNPASFYTPEEHALAKGMTGDRFVDFTLNDLGGISLGSSRAGNPLLGGGSFFTGIPTPDMNVGDLATLDTLPLEERMDALRRLSPDKQAELDFAAALQSGVNPFGSAPNIQETSQPVQQVSLQTPETATPVQVADRGPLDHLGDFLVTPVQAGTLPPQQESQRGPETFYKASPIGLPTANDLRISASDFKPMDLADIDRRNAPIPITKQAQDSIKQALKTHPVEKPQPQQVSWLDSGGGEGQLRSVLELRKGLIDRENAKNRKPMDQIIHEAVEGGKPRAVMRGDRLLYETPMQRQIREQQEAERRKSDDPNIMFNINRYNFDYTDENEDYALENLHPRYQAAVRSYITDLFSAGDMTPMGSGSENSTRASVIAEKELQALKAMANLDSTSRSYATGVLKAIIARRPELMAKGRQAIAYINDYRDPRFNTTKGHISLDTHYRAEAGDNQAIKQEMEIIKETEALGKAQLAKEQKVNEFLSNPAVVTKNYGKVDSKEQTFMKDAAQIYMDTHDFKDADDQAIHALAFAMTIDDLPIERRFLGSFDPDKDRFLQLGGNRFSRFIRYSGAEDIDPDGNGLFGETFRRNLQILRRERLSGKALTNRMLSFIGYDSKKDNNK